MAIGQPKSKRIYRYKKIHWNTIHKPLSKVIETSIFLEKSIKLKQRKDTVITGDFTTVKISTEKIFLTICSFLTNS